MKFRQRVTCRLCNHGQLARVLSLPPTPLANSFMKTREEAVALPTYPLDVNACERCGHHQLGVVVDAEEMFTNYAYASGTAKSFRDHFTSYAAEIVRRFRLPATGFDQVGLEVPFRVLEVGSNDGTMMKALRAAGATHVTGIEPATNLVMRCLGDGLNVIRGYANDSTIIHHNIRADFWTANNVLAHVDDFVGTLNALSITGARAGVFEVQYLGALLDGGMFDMVYHEHLDYWRATELVKHLHQYTPWRVFSVEHVPTHGGSLRVWVKRNEGESPDYHTPGLLNDEQGRDWPVNWAALQETMAFERRRLWTLLGNKRVVVYGAPAKLTTLMYGLGITNLNYAYVVDDSPLKQGLFTPGTGLEVKGSTALLNRDFDAILIGAWNFAKHIKETIYTMRGMDREPLIVVPFQS